MDFVSARSVQIAAPDDSLIRALAEHRPPATGWRFAPLGEAPEPDALIVVDIDDEAQRRRKVETIRAEGFAGPILIIGGSWGGAGTALLPEDEPIARPVRLGTLLARIDAHAAEPEGAETYSLGPYEFAPAERTLRHRLNGELIRLTELERKLLTCLAEAAGAALERERLLARVWGYSASVATHTVETHIWRLRQKVETDDPATRFILTEAGGYRLALAEADSGA